VNFFLIIYWVLIAGFVITAFIILYHLWVFHLNRKTALLMSVFFVVGSLILLFINFGIASQIPWDEFSILF